MRMVLYVFEQGHGFPGSDCARRLAKCVGDAIEVHAISTHGEAIALRQRGVLGAPTLICEYEDEDVAYSGSDAIRYLTQLKADHGEKTDDRADDEFVSDQALQEDKEKSASDIEEALKAQMKLRELS